MRHSAVVSDNTAHNDHMPEAHGHAIVQLGKSRPVVTNETTINECSFTGESGYAFASLASALWPPVKLKLALPQDAKPGSGSATGF